MATFNAMINCLMIGETHLIIASKGIQYSHIFIERDKDPFLSSCE